MKNKKETIASLAKSIRRDQKLRRILVLPIMILLIAFIAWTAKHRADIFGQYLEKSALSNDATPGEIRCVAILDTLYLMASTVPLTISVSFGVFATLLTLCTNHREKLLLKLADKITENEDKE